MVNKSVCYTLALFLVVSFLMPRAFAEKAEEASAVVRDELMPLLEGDTHMLLLFAAELNISNGDPHTRDFGERGMFGKLVNAAYVEEHYDELVPQKDAILAEVKRLLWGDWANGGYTAFSFATRYNKQVLSYETGEWTKIEEVRTIRIEHCTELSNRHRVTYIAYGEFGFGVVR